MKLNQRATDVLDPINVVATWTAGITAAAGTSLAQSLFVSLFARYKSFPKKESTRDSSLILSNIGEFS